MDSMKEDPITITLRDQHQTLVAAKGLHGTSVSKEGVQRVVAGACPAKDYKDKKVLVIIPDATRTAPVGLLFKTLHEQIGGVAAALDILVALGTHQPMSEEAICERWKSL
jgi:nickel-dependent lactate racemase